MNYGAIPVIVGDQPWVDGALCTQTDPELFFPPKGATGKEAKRVCRLCAVQTDCLGYAVQHRVPYGIWGGTTAHERRHMK